VVVVCLASFRSLFVARKKPSISSPYADLSGGRYGGGYWPSHGYDSNAARTQRTLGGTRTSPFDETELDEVHFASGDRHEIANDRKQGNITIARSFTVTGKSGMSSFGNGHAKDHDSSSQDSILH